MPRRPHCTGLRWALLLITMALIGACQGEDMDITDGYRPAAEVRRTGNRLRDEASLYLQQHARNPVDWHPWGEQALAAARTQDKPIFLSSGYASCHWCHVMEHEVFEHDDVAEVLNRHFVCIKLDREEHPAIDATYMQAVQMLTGGGGWPMSVFMTPDLKPFFGGTYIPHDRFLNLCERVVEAWTTQRAQLENQAGQISQRILAEPNVESVGAGAVGHAMMQEVVAATGERFDEQFAGMAGERKFPVPVRWSFLLDWYRRTGDPLAREMTERTLDAMARGGLRDHVGGGFHRYTVDEDWTVPHFEKMLYDNAQLASLFLAAGAAFERPDLTAVGVDVLEFLDRDMSGEEGPCYASFDADSGGEEGTYYVWTPAQITAAVGAEDGPALAGVLGVGAAGNFEHGASVATQRADLDAVAAAFGRDRDEVAGLFAAHRAALRAVRDGRTPPGLDRKIVTSWNGLAITAFTHGYRATECVDFLERAQAIAAYLRRVHRREDGTLHRASNGGQPSGIAILDDYVLLVRGLLDLYQADGDPAHLAWAHELLEVVRTRFAREGGGWYTTADSDDVPLGRRTDVFDSVIPCGASVAVDALVTYGSLTGRTEALDEAQRQVAAQGGLLPRAGLEMAGWLTAALRLEGPLYDVVVAGEARDDRTGALYRAAAAGLAPGVVVTRLPAAGATDAQLELAPALAGKSAPAGEPTAFVCERGICQAPSSEPARIGALILEGWVR